MARAKAIKLTAREERLLAYPPTEETWLCEHIESDEDGEIYLRRTVANSGGQDRCFACGDPKPRNARLLWPEYQAALAKKAAIEQKESAAC